MKAKEEVKKSLSTDDIGFLSSSFLLFFEEAIKDEEHLTREQIISICNESMERAKKHLKIEKESRF